MEDKELYHYGLKGMHWGERRFQDESGLLTPAGRARYGVGPAEGSPKSHTAFSSTKELGSSIKSHNSLVKDSKKSLKQLNKDYRKGNISYKDYQKSLSDMSKNIKESGKNLKNTSLDSAKSISIKKTLAVAGGMAVAGIALNAASKKGNDLASMYMKEIGTQLIVTGAAGALGGIASKKLAEKGSSLARTGADLSSEKAGNRTVKKIEKAKYNMAVDKAYANYDKAINKIESKYERGQKLSEADMQKEQEVQKRYEDAVERLRKQYKGK